MAQTGTVISAGLNLRATPGGTIVDVLKQGAVVEIIESQNGFLKVNADGKTGFVAAKFIKQDEGQPSQPDAPSPPAPAPAPATSGSFHFEGNKAVAPDGTVFGRKNKLGIYNYGQTSIGQFVSAHSEVFTALSPSRLSVMQAVSANEGKLEAINTWDNAFLTFGAFQWTAGAGSGAGELVSLIARLKQSDESVFNQLFGQSGLDVASVSSPPGQTPTGFFSLNGAPIRSAADKAQKLRTLERAYQFFKAGQNDVMRRVEVEHAASRIDLFYKDASHRIKGLFVADFISSEAGVAMLLDEHVNRPGNVPTTLAGAVNQFITASGKNNPQTWTDQDERTVLNIYIQRRNRTSMTDSQNRANSILQSGLASTARGSFQD
ncbi:MAG TPA: SH3 domain-containing protein [Pyrinomonadaceae bacterium]